VTSPDASLFEQVGGRAGVDRILEAFYRFVEADAVQRALYPEDLEPGKRKLKLFFEQWLGGEAGYSALYGHPRLRRRHFPIVIDDLAAGRWLRYMQAAMSECGVRREDLTVIFERLGPLAHHMVNAGEDIPREPLSEAVMQ
jgi:hemoglobin